MASYPKTIKAALAETQSKFALAEAIATEIPKTASENGNVLAELTAMADAIEMAGGEARSVATLRGYRVTALWTMDISSSRCEWREGSSFSAHSSAANYGVDRDWFYKVPRTVDEVRKQVGARSTQGVTVDVGEMTTLEKVELLQQLAADDPETAIDVVAKAKAADIVNKTPERKTFNPDGNARPLASSKDIGSLLSEMQREAKSLEKFLAPRWAQFADKYWDEMSESERTSVKASIESITASVELIRDAIQVS